MVSWSDPRPRRGAGVARGQRRPGGSHRRRGCARETDWLLDVESLGHAAGHGRQRRHCVSVGERLRRTLPIFPLSALFDVRRAAVETRGAGEILSAIEPVQAATGEQRRSQPWRLISGEDAEQGRLSVGVATWREWFRGEITGIRGRKKTRFSAFV